MVLTAVGAELSVSDVDSGGKGILKKKKFTGVLKDLNREED